MEIKLNGWALILTAVAFLWATSSFLAGITPNAYPGSNPLPISLHNKITVNKTGVYVQTDKGVQKLNTPKASTIVVTTSKTGETKVITEGGWIGFYTKPYIGITSAGIKVHPVVGLNLLRSDNLGISCGGFIGTEVMGLSITRDITYNLSAGISAVATPLGSNYGLIMTIEF